MNAERFQQLAKGFTRLKLAVVGDFCLDRYLEIDPALEETSIETGLPVRNVINVRAQPGGAGTILNNLLALGVGRIYPVGFAGMDGEGFELRRALRGDLRVCMDHFVDTTLRRTFTYCKPLILEPGQAPRELNRLDSKNWTATPAIVEGQIAGAIEALAPTLDGLIVLDQVDKPETGVVTARVLETIDAVAKGNPKLIVMADSRRGLRGYPPFIFKMNAAEFAIMSGLEEKPDHDQLRQMIAAFARQLGKPVFVTAAERGIWGADAAGQVAHVPALPVRGPIDIVGAGDAVTANVACALAAGGELREALELAMCAASVVIHKLGTTGTASPEEMFPLLQSPWLRETP